MSTSGTRVRRRIRPAIVGNFSPGYINLAKDGIPNGQWGSTAYQQPTFLQLPFYEMKVTTDELHSGPPYKEGGPFSSLTFEHIPAKRVIGVGVYPYADFSKKYTGGFTLPPRYQFGLGFADEWDFEGLTTQAAFNLTSSHHPNMSDWGSKAWSSTKPKLEKAGLAVFIAEMRDVPTMLRTTAKGFHNIWTTMGGSTKSDSMRPKKVANHFLNHQFGWVPFLKDIQKFHYNLSIMDKRVADISARNGLWTRRRATLLTVNTDTRISGGLGNKLQPPLDGPPFHSSRAFWEIRETVFHHITAVGSFSYYRPEFDSSLPDYRSGWNDAIRHMTILGARVTPSNVYNAIPWTWAIDWVSNVGDHIDHLNDIVVDSVANKYLYLMQRKKRTRTLYQTIPTPSGVLNLEMSRVIDSKQRQEGTSPYGFSLSLGDLTPRQIAIAISLGISKGFHLAR